MAFDPVQFWQLGQDLATPATDEAKVRTAVGRVYYAAFLVARDKVGVTGRRAVHQKTSSALKKGRGSRALGDKLNTLFRLRGVADYQLVPSDPAQRDWAANWKYASALASEIIPKLQALR